jgi:hypothetical protein
MADEEQLRILKQGGGAWNAWRQQAGDIVFDLRRAVLLEAYLHGVDLSAADLRGANPSLNQPPRGQAGRGQTQWGQTTWGRPSRAFLRGAKEAWAAKLRDNRHIGDFRDWKDHDLSARVSVSGTAGSRAMRSCINGPCLCGTATWAVHPWSWWRACAAPGPCWRRPGVRPAPCGPPGPPR